MECGSWEWIDGELDGKAESNGKGKTGRNEFGGESRISTRQMTWNWCIRADSSDLGLEKIGIERLKEALEACEWEGVDGDTTSDDLGLEDGFGAEAAEVEREMMGLKMVVNGAEGSDKGADEGVEELENMMLKLRAIKDMGADMPESERRKFATKAVKAVMKDL